MIQKTTSKAYIIVELAVLFVILPVLYWFDLVPFHKVIPLIFLFVYCTIILFGHRRINGDKFSLVANWKVILARFFVISILIFLLIKLFSQYPFFADLSENKKLLYMLFMYPVLSAFPQELIFREFFFYRYGNIFRHKAVLLGINIILFSFAHIYFANWIVIAFTLVGGFIFSLTFFKTRSLLVVTIEHALYGVMILSSGLSVHFYKAF